MEVKFSVMLPLITSMAVRIPTSAMMPRAIIRIVRIVLRDWDLIDERAIFIFSNNSGFIGPNLEHLRLRKLIAA